MRFRGLPAGSLRLANIRFKKSVSISDTSLNYRTAPMWQSVKLSRMNMLDQRTLLFESVIYWSQKEVRQNTGLTLSVRTSENQIEIGVNNWKKIFLFLFVSKWKRRCYWFYLSPPYWFFSFLQVLFTTNFSTDLRLTLFTIVSYLSILIPAIFF